MSVGTKAPLPTGRELDALVAEKVFGCSVVKEFDDVEMDYLCYVKGHDHKGYGVVPRVAPYSTDIAAAWDIVEKLRLGVFPCMGTKWIAIQHMSDLEIVNPEESAPLAICLAALKAVGV